MLASFMSKLTKRATYFYSKSFEMKHDFVREINNITRSFGTKNVILLY